ncbi:MAG: hypothetical protein ACTTH8_05505 [Treponema sp.]
MINTLLLIDPQNDFCTPNGTLFVPGSPSDCRRIADFIETNNEKLNAIYITLDSHPYYHIAHPPFWKDAQGNTPPPFTQITYSDYCAGIFQPVQPGIKEKVGNYIQELEKRGKYNLVLWPFHCLQGSTGMSVEAHILHAIHEWESQRPGIKAYFINKSDNSYTEHYSALQAEVPDPQDDSTKLNTALIESLQQSDRIIIAGEALSHCVANTVRDLAQYIDPRVMTLLSDCSSPVTGFEKMGMSFVQEMTAAGMKYISSTDFVW